MTEKKTAREKAVSKPPTVEKKTAARSSKTVPRKKKATTSKKKVPTEISWRIHLAAERPARTVFALLIILGSTFAAGFWWHPVVAILILLVFFASLNNHFVPITYYLDSEEIKIKKFYYTDKRQWNMFRRFFMTPSGVVLSTFTTRKKFLDNFRGVQLILPLDETERNKVLDFIESKLPLDSGQSRQ